MDRYELLLKNWCDSLIRLQIRGYGAPHDGGFLCPACTAIHGRADNAFYPFMYLYQRTGDEKYYEAAEAVFDWHGRLVNREKAAYNDLNNLWTGTTTFSAIGYYKALTKTGAVIRPALRTRVEKRLREAAGWVYDHMRLSMDFQTNINYYAAAAAVFADCGSFFGLPEYLREARLLIDYCMDHFTQSGLFLGEGFPHDEKTARGCGPVDMGYNLEESIPCLTEAAEALKDEALLRQLAARMRQNIEFMLPDGGIDNSFGSRNNKWTYYGSRTSDGCIAALMTLGKYDPVLTEAAYRNIDLQEKCTENGLLHGGRQYAALGLKPCTHHSLCHAVALADALQEGLSEENRLKMTKLSLPCESDEPYLRYYPEIDTYRIRFGRFLADVTGYDYRTYTFSNGAAHASGGTLTLLYDRDNGPVIAGSTVEYKQTEPLNMQAPVLELPHETLLPRLEYTLNGEKHLSCLETDVRMEAKADEGRVEIRAKAEKYEFAYLFEPERVTLFVKLKPELARTDAVFVLPVIRDTLSACSAVTEPVHPAYWLAGGFGADVYTFRPDEKGEIAVVLK